LERILVIKFGDLGDALLIAPALASLRERFPRATIDVLSNPSGCRILGHLTTHSRLIVFDKAQFDRPSGIARPAALRALMECGRALRRERYDAVLVLHHLQTGWGTAKFAGLALATGAPRRFGLDNGLGWFLTDRTPDFGFGVRHEADYWLQVVGLVGANPEPRLASFPVSSSDDERAAELLGGNRHPVVAIHPGTGIYAPARRWFPDGFAAVANHLSSVYHAQIVLLGGPDDESLPAKVKAGMIVPPIDLAGQTSLGELAAVLRRCDLFVGSDSGVMHLAAAVRTPVVAVFGPSNHRAWGPYDAGQRRHRIVRRDLACSPCIYVGFGPGRPSGCGSRDCLTGLDVDSVLAAIDDVLSRRATAS
jgi:lipopolysaccharide heptosyltransferase II